MIYESPAQGRVGRVEMWEKMRDWGHLPPRAATAAGSIKGRPKGRLMGADRDAGHYQNGGGWISQVSERGGDIILMRLWVARWRRSVELVAAVLSSTHQGGSTHAEQAGTHLRGLLGETLRLGPQPTGTGRKQSPGKGVF